MCAKLCTFNLTRCTDALPLAFFARLLNKEMCGVEGCTCNQSIHGMQIDTFANQQGGPTPRFMPYTPKFLREMGGGEAPEGSIAGTYLRNVCILRTYKMYACVHFYTRANIYSEAW